MLRNKFWHDDTEVSVNIAGLDRFFKEKAENSGPFTPFLLSHDALKAALLDYLGLEEVPDPPVENLVRRGDRIKAIMGCPGVENVVYGRVVDNETPGDFRIIVSESSNRVCRNGQTFSIFLDDDHVTAYDLQGNQVTGYDPS